MNWGPKYGFIWFPSAIIATVWIFFFLPETKERTLEEIDEMVLLIQNLLRVFELTWLHSLLQGFRPVNSKATSVPPPRSRRRRWPPRREVLRYPLRRIDLSATYHSEGGDVGNMFLSECDGLVRQPPWEVMALRYAVIRASVVSRMRL